MAFRIHDSVVRGEIDNRVKGMVRGKIWVEGRAEPVSAAEADAYQEAAYRHHHSGTEPVVKTAHDNARYSL